MSARVLRTPPCPGVRFEEGFSRRLAETVLRVKAARERREGSGVPSRLGGGSEFVGFRPYAPGDDLRGLDWDLLARSDRPWIRVGRREAGERWLVRLDASASMGVGPPGKLQRAAEVAAGIAALALEQRAEARVVASPGERRIDVARRSSLPSLLSFLESLRAQGRAERVPPRADPETSRVFRIGDLRGEEPRDLLAMRSGGRELAVVQILAPVELTPPGEGSITWWDPEGGAELVLAIDAGVRAAYERELAAEIDRWRSLCARHGVPFGCFSSAQGFETLLARIAGA